jgi:hypothetical protein
VQFSDFKADHRWNRQVCKRVKSVALWSQKDHNSSCPTARSTFKNKNGFHSLTLNDIMFFSSHSFANLPIPTVVGKKCNPNPSRTLTEMSRTGNLLLLISSLILGCFLKTFLFIVKNRFIYLCGSGYTFYRSWNQKSAPFNFLNIFRHLIYLNVFILCIDSMIKSFKNYNWQAMCLLFHYFFPFLFSFWKGVYINFYSFS